MTDTRYEQARRIHEDLFDEWFFELTKKLGTSTPSRDAVHEAFEQMKYVLCPSPPEEDPKGTHFSLIVTVDAGRDLGALSLALQSLGMVSRNLTLVSRVDIALQGFEPTIVAGHDDEPF